MEASELLAAVVRALESERIPYALAGSVASMGYGEPRATLDIDIVVGLEPDDVPVLRRLFPAPAFYMDEDVARSVALRGGQFNVIHPESGLKIDFFVPGDAIAEAQLARSRRRLALPELEASFSPPEELIIKKLQYYVAGGSDKHLRDIAAMVRISPGELDLERVEDLATEHGLLEVWREVRRRAEA